MARGRRNTESSERFRISIGLPVSQREEVDAAARFRGYLALGSYVRGLIEMDLLRVQAEMEVPTWTGRWG